MTAHHVVEDDGVYVCSRCVSLWDQPRPMSACAGSPRPCPEADWLPSHHFGTDGHCHHCGEVDR